jgi:hypothetical protein
MAVQFIPLLLLLNHWKVEEATLVVTFSVSLLPGQMDWEEGLERICRFGLMYMFLIAESAGQLLVLLLFSLS